MARKRTEEERRGRSALTKRAPRHAEDDAALSGSLARGLAILDALRAASRPLTLAETAAQVGLDNSTTYRLLRMVEIAGLLVRDENSRRYMPSARALSPLPLLHPLNRLRRDSQPLLQRLSDEVGETVALIIFINSTRMVVEIGQQQNSLFPYYNPWLEGPLHCTGSGKALLSTLEPDRRAAILGKEPYPSLTPYTLTSLDALNANLAKFQDGTIVSQNEHREGLTTIAANVPSWRSGQIGCINVTCHSVRFTKTHAAHISRAVQRVTNLLTFQSPSIDELAALFSTPSSPMGSRQRRVTEQGKGETADGKVD